MAAVHEALDRRLPAVREALFELLRIPSMSGVPDHAADVRRAADWLVDHCGGLGLEASLHETRGHPVVLAEWRGAGRGTPTLLVYGHYDVQPPDPVAAWSSPPFEPELRDGRIYGRGVVDDKGQLFVHLAALGAWLDAAGGLPVDVVVLIEGEEEVASPSLGGFIEANRERLACDGVVISDTTMVAPDVPTIGASLRGGIKFEIEVAGPDRDLHSGVYGGTVRNPAEALAHILASFHDDALRVAIPGFYDDVDPATDYRRAIAAVPFSEAEYLRETGAPALRGEAGFGVQERRWVRPTVEVNGVSSGYAGPGPKSIIPARARAKVSCRLVPDQDPDTVARCFIGHVRRVAPDGVEVSVESWPGRARPWRVRADSDVVRAGRRALERVFGRPPIQAGEGGSIPVVPMLEETLGAPVLLLGFGLPGENAHAPDEWMSDALLVKGAHVAAELLRELGR